jgi:hypothetical protein
MLEKMPRKLVLNVLLATLVVAYVALLHSPLRLAGDSPVYLCDASDLADGRGFHDDHLPRGYPHALAALDLIHFGSSTGIVALNLLTMAVGLVCTATVLRREFELSPTETNTICLLVCCSWMWIQLATFPLSEPLFFAFSSMVLAMLSLAKDRPNWQAALYLWVAGLLAVAAFFVRTIGAALFLAVGLAVLQTPFVRRFLGRRGALLLFSVGLVLATGLGFALRDRIASAWYVNAIAYLKSSQTTLHTAKDVVNWRIGEIGELVQNVSSTAVIPTTPNLPIKTTSPGVLVMLQLRAVRMVTGVAALVLILAGLWARRRQFGPVEVYLLGFVGILLIWPFDDTRFFAPVLPLILAYAWRGLRSWPIRPQNLRRFAVAYSVVFCVFGALALGDSLRVTYFDRGQPWRECGSYVTAFPLWLTAFDRYGGVRPEKIHRTPQPPRVVP